MKTQITIIAILFATGAFAQTNPAGNNPSGPKPTVAVLNIDSKGIMHDSQEMGYMVRLELEKTKVYSVLDRYEVADVVSKNKIDVNNCYAKTCLVEAGKILKADKMLSGSAERFGEKIVITLRLIDVATGTIEKSDATEYLNLPEVQKMVEISVKKIVGIQPDQNMVNLLIDYDVPIQSPRNTLRLNGPRMGLSYTMGDAGKIMVKPESKGGFNMYPLTFDFGWQQEFQYISAGNFQALVENIFLIGGLESGKFIPNYAPLLGFRFGKGAWEFAFGSTFRFIRKAEGFYDKDGLIGEANEWHLDKDWNTTQPNAVDNSSGLPVLKKNPNVMESRLDSRGSTSLSTGLVLAVGKTFKSGYLNIPVNIFIAPRKDGTTVGATFGFNIQKKRTVE